MASALNFYLIYFSIFLHRCLNIDSNWYDFMSVCMCACVCALCNAIVVCLKVHYIAGMLVVVCVISLIKIAFSAPNRLWYKNKFEWWMEFCKGFHYLFLHSLLLFCCNALHFSRNCFFLLTRLFLFIIIYIFFLLLLYFFFLP